MTKIFRKYVLYTSYEYLFGVFEPAWFERTLAFVSSKGGNALWSCGYDIPRVSPVFSRVVFFFGGGGAKDHFPSYLAKIVGSGQLLILQKLVYYIKNVMGIEWPILTGNYFERARNSEIKPEISYNSRFSRQCSQQKPMSRHS